MGSDIGPAGAGIGQGGFAEEFEGLLAGGGVVTGDGGVIADARTIGDGGITGQREERAQEDVYPAEELTA